jgi:hypothetical protein
MSEKFLQGIALIVMVIFFSWALFHLEAWVMRVLCENVLRPDLESCIRILKPL